MNKTATVLILLWGLALGLPAPMDWPAVAFSPGVAFGKSKPTVVVVPFTAEVKEAKKPAKRLVQALDRVIRDNLPFAELKSDLVERVRKKWREGDSDAVNAVRIGGKFKKVMAVVTGVVKQKDGNWVIVFKLLDTKLGLLLYKNRVPLGPAFPLNFDDIAANAIVEMVRALLDVQAQASDG